MKKGLSGEGNKGRNSNCGNDSLFESHFLLIINDYCHIHKNVQ